MLSALRRCARPLLLPTLLICCAVSPSVAENKPSAAKLDAPLSLTIPIQRATLDNGLRVVMNVDRSSPTVSIAVTYDVGSRDEEPGKTGFAHSFEHLMFGGTKNLSNGQLEQLVMGRGGLFSADTAVDFTNYHEILPENELPLGLWLEAERMRFLDITQTAFDAARKSIQEEHRLHVYDSPYGRAHWHLQEMVFEGCFAYGHPAPGASEDLARAELASVKSFYASHYGPNTAVLAISGDIDPDLTMTLVHKHFDAIPRIAAKPFAEPACKEQTAERRTVIADPRARGSVLSYGFALPKPMTREHDALRFAAVILGAGDNARLPALLIRDKALATIANASIDDRSFLRVPGLLRMNVRIAPNITAAQVEAQVDAVLLELATKPPTPDEMQRARRKLETELVNRVAGTRDRAIELGKYEIGFGDAKWLTRAFDRFAAVTADDVQKAIAKYLDKTRRSVIESQPVAKPSENMATADGRAP